MTLKTVAKNAVVLSFVICFTADFTKADVSMKQHTKQDGIASSEWTSTIRIKGLKMRVDTMTKGENSVSLYDLDAGKQYVFHPKRKEITVVDLKSASEHLKGGFLPEKLRRVIKETGKKGTVGALSCDEYTFDMQAPSAPSHGLLLIQHDSGTVCVSQTIPEGVEVTNFVLEAKKRGYTAAASVLSPGSSSLGPYFFGQQPNVMVLSADAETNVDSPVYTGLYMRSKVTITEIKSDAISDEDFQIPTDWKQIKDKQFR